MTGAVVAAAAIAAANGHPVAVTVGDFGGGGAYGFLIDSTGAISGNVKGTAIRALNVGAAYDLAIRLTGHVSQSYFSHVVVQATNGTWIKYRQQDATFTQPTGPDVSDWIWGDASNRAWTSTTSPRAVIFFY
jgi:hypothetical protein